MPSLASLRLPRDVRSFFDAFPRATAEAHVDQQLELLRGFTGQLRINHVLRDGVEAVAFLLVLF